MYEGAYRYRRYKRPLGKKKYILLVAVLLTVFFLLFAFQKRATRLLLSLGEESARAVAAQALNDAALQAMQWNADDYSSFVIVSRDGEGNILSMQADAQKINLLARQTVALTMANLNEACEKGVGVPLGAFFGIELLAGVGPDIPFRLIPVLLFPFFLCFGGIESVHVFRVYGRECGGQPRHAFGHEQRQRGGGDPRLRKRYRGQDPGSIFSGRDRGALKKNYVCR